MLYEILASKTHNPHYLNKYITFISNCQEKNKNYTGYTEQHHICPKAHDMFPEFASFTSNSWNCAKLTARQHYIAHILLYKSYPDIASNGIALRLMNKYKYRIKLNNPNEGKVPVRDTLGNTSQVAITDSRYISGELVHVVKGLVSKTRKLTDAQVIEIRSSLLNPQAILTIDFIKSKVAKKYYSKVGKYPTEALCYRNGSKVTTQSLVILYYSDKYFIEQSTIQRILCNKTYKEVTI